MPTTDQKSDKAYKKLQGLSTTGNNRFPFNEPFPGPISINPQQIWVEQHLIPNTAPSGMTNGQTVGIVQRFIDLRLKSVAGTTNSFYHESLKDCLPHTYGDQTSYNLLLKDGAGSQIVFGQGDWEVDPDAGLITFFGTVPAGVGTNYPTNTPQISFFRYVGPKGNTVLYLSQAEISSTSGTSGLDSYNFKAPLTGYTSNAVYILRPTQTNTGPVSININGLGSKAVKKVTDTALSPIVAGDVKQNISYILIYDKYNDVFQLFSGIGGGGADSSAVLNVDLTAPGTINYQVLGFADIGSVQFYEKNGNTYTLVNADIDVEEIAKTITVNTLSTVQGILRIVGAGDNIVSGTSGSSAPYLYELNDVDIESLEEGQSIFWDGSNWVNQFPPTPRIINTTFQSITTDRDNSDLIPGAFYRYPHQTKHVIPNTGDIHLGTLEHLIVPAITSAQLSTQVYSDINIQDIIYFDFDDILCENGTSGREGKITYRKDTSRNISTYYDFRNVLYRRWFNFVRQAYTDLSNNGGSSSDFYTFTFQSNGTYNVEIKPYIPVDTLVYNNIIVGDDSASNNIFNEGCHDIILTRYCENNVFGPGCFDIALTGLDNSRESSNNTFDSNCYTNTLLNVENSEFTSGANGISLISGTGDTVLTGFKLRINNTLNLIVDTDTVNLDNIVVDMIDPSGVLWYKTIDILGNLTTNPLS